ncbi:hypothetical protein QVZ43_04640 [Marinobacter sp. chi1]|uniref:Uncharacterized protein n=1 Tax=Marinobacter suaedae TaxID=3057675 RepID=A0ABT8VYD9_9GAMM|nr:hypothetical protein [Marinobacter sp. chi1]MDO3720997.1 hypothetical protein [Marinobacter sp. chi1]
MFASIRMTFGFNAALKALGIDPAKIDLSFRRCVQSMALEEGYNAKEAATFMFYQLPLGRVPLDTELKMLAWVSQGKMGSDVIEKAQRAEIQVMLPLEEVGHLDLSR